jgi:hypothetical protein
VRKYRATVAKKQQSLEATSYSEVSAYFAAAQN